MYVAVLSSDKARAKRLGDEILDICLSNGCYSTFLSFAADHGFLNELERREFGTVVITADGEEELLLARAVADRQPQARLILLGSDEAAVKGYALRADYCSAAQPGKEDLERIMEIIFPLARQSAAGAMFEFRKEEDHDYQQECV